MIVEQQHRHPRQLQPSPEELRTGLRNALEVHPLLRHAVLVNRTGDLPLAVQHEILQKGLDPTRVRGVHTQEAIYLVCANLPDVTTGLQVALHEAVGHQGLRAVLGEQLEPVMIDLYWTFPRSHDAWTHTAEHYAYLDSGTRAGQVAFAEELCAYLAETNATLGEWDMVQAEIRMVIREQFPALPMNELDVNALVQRSRESLILRHGDPGEAEAIRDKQARRAYATEVVIDSLARNGRWAPDAMSLALWREGSQVVNEDGVPCRLFHGAGAAIDNIRRGFWGSTDPELASQYAAMRQESGNPAQVVPFYADIRQAFDGDALKHMPDEQYPDGLSVRAFFDELIRQSEAGPSKVEQLRELERSLRLAGRREESGPTYDPKDFWYQPHFLFGLDGREMLEQAFALAGFDGVRFTEQGHLTYGAFSPDQVHFLDQGASPRGLPYERRQGHLPLTERVAFRQWFGNSHVVDTDGRAKVVYHGTAQSFDAFAARAQGDNFSEFEGAFPRDGFWFTDAPDNALWYANVSAKGGNGQRTLPVYLSLKNPYRYTAERFEEEGSAGIPSQAELEREGYDGIIVELTEDAEALNPAAEAMWGTYTPVYGAPLGWPASLREEYERLLDVPPVIRHVHYVAFRPEQVKSIYNRGDFDPSNPDILFSFAGRNAHTADRSQLAYAQQAIAAGMNPELVRQECGWFQGIEGGWRFEIDDSQCYLKPPFPHKGQRWGDVHEGIYRRTLMAEGRGITVGDMLEHAELLAAYPRLCSLGVDRGPGKQCALHLGGGGEPPQIVIGEDTTMDEMKRILLHEVQHFIQIQEGFARGGSARKGRVSPAVWQAAVATMECRHGALPAVREKAAERDAGALSQEDYEQWLVNCAEAVETNGVQGLLTWNYYRLAGEVEARNVEARRHMSSEQRRQTPPPATQDVELGHMLLDRRATIAAREEEQHLANAAEPSSVDLQNCAVVNHTAAGQRLKAMAEDYIHLLDDAGFEFGWLDGGCRVFAEGLRHWSEGTIEMGAMSFDPTLASHAVGVLTLEIGGMPFQVLLDADGASSETGMARKLAILEQSAGERLVAVGPGADALVEELPIDHQVAKRAGMAMARYLGPFPQWRESLIRALTATPALDRPTPASPDPLLPEEAGRVPRMPCP